MKTLNNNYLKAITRIFSVAGLLLIASCTGMKNSEQESKQSASQTKIKPPQIDIHTAVLTENHEVLQQHILAGSNLNQEDPFGGSSPLITAAVFGKTEMAQTLIEAGADLNFQNKDGSTALHTAAFFCRPEIVKMLLDKGADKTIKNKFGATAYESVAAPFAEAKNGYDMMGKMLAPMGLKLDYAHLQKTRPEIATMLK
jgi:uncharacterized protein